MLFSRKAVIRIANLIITAEDLLDVDLRNQPLVDDRLIIRCSYFFIFAVTGIADLVFCVLRYRDTVKQCVRPQLDDAVNDKTLIVIRVIAFSHDEHDDAAQRSKIDWLIVVHEMMDLFVTKTDNIQLEVFGRPSIRFRRVSEYFAKLAEKKTGCSV